MSRGASAGAVAAAAIAALAPVAYAAPAQAPRSTVDFSYTTTQPGSPTGSMFETHFRNPSNPALDPPSVRRIVLGNSGSLVDLGAAPLCKASDQDLKNRGPSACPAGSHIGGGTADVKPVGIPKVHYTSTLFNTPASQTELLTGGSFAPPTVVHSYFRDGVLDGPVPTCLNGGYPPKDCPTDQVALLGNTLNIPAVVSGTGPGRKSYLTTPAACPRSHLWKTPVTFYYGDGVVEHLAPTQPCKPAPTRLSVTPRRVRKGATTTYRFRAKVKLGGYWRPLVGALVRFAGHRAATDTRGRAVQHLRVSHRPAKRARLTKPGYRPATALVRVRG